MPVLLGAQITSYEVGCIATLLMNDKWKSKSKARLVAIQLAVYLFKVTGLMVMKGDEE